MCKRLRKVGKGKVRHKNLIDKGDIKKLYEHPFNICTPSGLLNKVWFEVLLYFCRRGHENLRDMRPHHFEVSHDDEGKQFIRKLSSEAKKSPHGDIVEDFKPEGGWMYGTGTALCPVASFIKYLGKLNPNYDVMWQKPRDSYDVNDSCWYEKKTFRNELVSSYDDTDI